MSTPGKHAPSSSRSFYMSLGRHGVAAVAVIGVVALVVAMATRGDDNGFGGEPTPTGSPSPSPTATATSTESPSPSPTATTRDPRPRDRITVSVLNGTGRGGLANQTSQRIVQAGFVVRNVGNAEQRARTVILFRPGFAPEARLLLEDFPDLVRARVGRDHPELDPDAMLTVVLGADYRT